MAGHRKTRMELSKEARRVMSRHSIDLSSCQYNVNASEIRLTGKLLKTNGTDYSGLEIEGLVKDLMMKLDGAMVVGECENWRFSSQHITFLGKRDTTKMSKEEADDLTSYDDFDVSA